MRKVTSHAFLRHHHFHSSIDLLGQGLDQFQLSPAPQVRGIRVIPLPLSCTVSRYRSLHRGAMISMWATRDVRERVLVAVRHQFAQDDADLMLVSASARTALASTE